MILKLTVLLAAGIFLVMLLAPEAPEPTAPIAKAPQASVPPPTPLTRTETPEEPVEPPAQQEVATAPPTPQVDRDAVAAALSEAQPEETTEDGVTAQDTEETARVLDGLSAGSLALSGSAVEALSLADGVRARTETPQAARNVPAQLDLSQPVETINVAPVEGQEAPDALALPTSLVIATSVNLRAGPSTAEAVVGRVSQGDIVEVIGPSATGWTGIRHPENGNTVYMASRFLEAVN